LTSTWPGPWLLSRRCAGAGSPFRSPDFSAASDCPEPLTEPASRDLRRFRLAAPPPTPPQTAQTPRRVRGISAALLFLRCASELKSPFARTAPSPSPESKRNSQSSTLPTEQSLFLNTTHSINLTGSLQDSASPSPHKPPGEIKNASSLPHSRVHGTAVERREKPHKELPAVRRAPERLLSQPPHSRGKKSCFSEARARFQGVGRQPPAPRARALSQPQSNACHYAAVCAGASTGRREGELHLNQCRAGIQTGRAPKAGAAERASPRQALPEEMGWASWSPRPRHPAEGRKSSRGWVIRAEMQP